MNVKVGGALKLEKIIVTTALIYANGEIHLGHITSTYLPADIFVRFHRLKGDNIIHVGATDDHGTPILVEAERQGKNPEEFVANWNKVDQRDFKDIGIDFDIFYKTSSKENIDLAQHFFNELHRKGHIFKQTIRQNYCENCKKFLPDRYVKGTCSYCGATDQYSDLCEKCGRTLEPGEIGQPHCAICGTPPISKQSEHYFFRLSKFSEQLKEWLTENKNLQPDVKNYVLNWVNEGLRDWDITRDLTWGVPIPLEEAKGKVLYGWFDNHLGYISTVQKYFSEKGVDGKEAWNKSKLYHFIGKDIVYHHYLFLPAMRLGEGEYKLPEHIPTRGHLLLESAKFSKSRDWYVSLKDFLNLFPADYLRYHLTNITSYSQSDVNFDWEGFKNRINNELIANIGNFVHRVLTFVWSNYGGNVPKPEEYDELDHELEEKINKVADEVGKEIECNELSRGLRKITEFSTFCNQFFQRKQPWADKQKAKTCIYLGINAVRSLAILLSPFIPFSAEKMWRQLNLNDSVHQQEWDSASELKIKGGHRINEPKILFQKIPEEVVQKEKEKLQRLGGKA